MPRKISKTFILKLTSTVLLMSVLTLSSYASVAFAQMQMQTSGQEYDCETCTMKVGAQAQEHLVVTDGNGTRHWVECIGCALKLLNTYDSIHIQTYCDWYGPNYPITIDVSEHGKTTTVSPTTAMLLMGGGCTGNRVAYNQTAADNLLANGYSENTMMMMQQALPANTNVTTFPARALTFAAAPVPSDSGNQNYLVPIVVATVGVVVILVSIAAYKKIKK